MTQTLFSPVVIVGAGIAGLACAIAAAPTPCLVIAPHGPGRGSASAWAQGGIAAAVGQGDTPEQHAADTLAAGNWHGTPEAVAALTQAGPDTIDWLFRLGVPFDRDRDGYVLSREAAHSCARVVRVGGDQAGREMTRALALHAQTLGSIRLQAGLTATALLRDDHGEVAGVVCRDTGANTVLIRARRVVLASGGIGGLYAVTTNPRHALGDGLAMATVAGAETRDLEFVQFHPTGLDVGRDPAPLASEALRGEGAMLVDRYGKPLCDPLAARDVVARAVAQARADGRGAFLDARTHPGAHFARDFPIIMAALDAAGLDPQRDLLPVAPAVHYHMGGVATDMDGHTRLPGLFALGEVGCTRVHGANRLASNSLLEAVVVARRAGARLQGTDAPPAASLPAPALPPTLPEKALQQLRGTMADHVGVVRDGDGLTQALGVIDDLTHEHGEALPLVAARAIARAALARRTSLGAHQRTDEEDAT